MNNYKISGWQGILSLAVVLLMPVFSSCTKDRLSVDGPTGKEYTDVTMMLIPPSSYVPIQSRALTTIQQNTISRATVLVFSNTTGALQYSKTVSLANNKLTVSLKTSTTDSDFFDIVVIGNPPSDFVPTVGQTKVELQSLLTIDVPVKWEGTEFVMWGELKKRLIKPEDNNLSISMLRSLARIDIGLGAHIPDDNDLNSDTWAGLTDFSLTSVHVVNTQSKAWAIPLPSALDATGNITAPSVPDAATVQGTTADDANKYTDITTVSNKGAYTNSSIFVAEAPNTANQVIIIVAGSYKDEATSYYRIDIGTPKAGGGIDYLNILRNHRYRINITKISGSGAATVEQALASSPINSNINSNVSTTLTTIDETENGGNIVFNGDSYIKTNVSSVSIKETPDGVKSYKLFTVKSSFPDGRSATITGTSPGFVPITLKSETLHTISVVLPVQQAPTTYHYTIKVGNITKIVTVTV